MAYVFLRPSLLWAMFLEVTGAFHVLSGGPLQWLQLSLGSSNLTSSLCPLRLMGGDTSHVARLWCFSSHSPGRSPFSQASSFAFSQLESATTETWLRLSSWSPGLSSSDDELGQPCLDLEEILGTMKGSSGGYVGRGLRRRELVGEALRPVPRARLSGVCRALLRRGSVVPCFLAGLVVLTEDCLDRGRPRSKQLYGEGTVGIYNVRVTFLIRKSETC